MAPLGLRFRERFNGGITPAPVCQEQLRQLTHRHIDYFRIKARRHCVSRRRTQMKMYQMKPNTGAQLCLGWSVVKTEKLASTT
jgi:hypothetical protein